MKTVILIQLFSKEPLAKALINRICHSERSEESLVYYTLNKKRDPSPELSGSG